MYDINILVNGNRCKQYIHNGKIFIEAKKGSEYAIEIKNNTYGRILAVCSVDSLDILNGKPATEQGNGYIINPYGSSKFDGFRVSNETVAKFVFDYKGASYATSKEDGSDRNVGVIGVRLFNEKIKVYKTQSSFSMWSPYLNNKYENTGTPYTPIPPTIWCDTTYGNMTDNTYGCLRSFCNSTFGGEAGNTPPGSKISTKGFGVSNTAEFTNCCNNTFQEKAHGFDMGTKWGEAKESRVIEVEFEKGDLVLTTDIYYASRESLIQMGVPIGNEKQVSFPEPFTSKYATPPKNWKG